MVSKVACFLTCGYTEAGEMQGFLSRCCNSDIRFVQCLPNKPKRKKKNGSIIKDEFSGLTHNGLVDKMMDIIKKHRGQYSNYRGIVFEDDLDDMTPEATYKRSASIKNMIKSEIGDIPVVIVFAAPEVETWFIADWNNGFGIYRKPEILKDHFSSLEGDFLNHHLRSFFNEVILGEYKEKMEEYGEQRPYKKLSEEIIHALDNPVEMDVANSFRRYLKELGDKNQELVDRLIECKNLHYSKKETGSVMLRNLEPKEVAQNCHLYFANAYREISTVFSD